MSRSDAGYTVPGRRSACRQHMVLVRHNLSRDGFGFVIEDIHAGIVVFFVDKCLLEVRKHLGSLAFKAFQIIA